VSTQRKCFDLQSSFGAGGKFPVGGGKFPVVGGRYVDGKGV
jgi:hypothetical protein